MSEKRKPQLLIGDHSNVDNLINVVVSNDYKPMNPQIPVCRFRGTCLEVSEDTIQITGWMRNSTRMRQMDVSLPAILTFQLNKDMIITDVAIHDSFKGSKGLLCSKTYLNRNLQQIVGLPFDEQFPFHKSMRQLHCFHLAEILLAAYSYYEMAKWLQSGSRLKPGTYYEEEIIDCYTQNSDLITGGIHLLKGQAPVYYGIQFYDVLRKAGFDRSGNLSAFDNVQTSFFINDKPIFSDVLRLGIGKKKIQPIQQFMMTSIEYIKHEICPGFDGTMMNTNLFPIASVSILVQALAMIFFKNNYQYVMHVLTALQRHNDKPYCLGGIKTDAERQHFFPDYHPADMGFN